MNNSHNALRNITSFRNTGKSQPISGIELMVDDKNMYFAGNDDGYVMTIDCPYGTQEMANDLLAKAKGFEYQGFTAEQVILPPETELGDGVTVAGVYGMIARRSFKFTPGMTSNIEAPRELEVQHEYKYSSPQQRKTERQIAETRSLITKTAEEIKLEIQGVDGRVSSLQLTLDGVTITGPDGVTRINGGMIQANSVTATQIDATNLKVDAANITGTLTIGQLPSSVAETGDIPTKVGQLSNDKGYQTEKGVTTIIDGRITTDYIDALGITAEYVSASAVLADGIELDGLLHVPGYGYLGGRRNVYNDGVVMVDEDMRAFCLAGSVSAAIVYDNYKIWVQYDGAFTNDSDGISVYSDRRMKHDIRYDIDRYDAFFDALKPASFLFNGDKSGRRKTGMIAQDVLAAMELAGIKQSDFSALKYNKEEDRYFLAYEPFISLCIEQIQRLKKRLNALETKLEGIA